MNALDNDRYTSDPVTPLSITGCAYESRHSLISVVKTDALKRNLYICVWIVNLSFRNMLLLRLFIARWYISVPLIALLNGNYRIRAIELLRVLLVARIMFISSNVWIISLVCKHKMLPLVRNLAHFGYHYAFKFTTVKVLAWGNYLWNFQGALCRQVLSVKDVWITYDNKFPRQR